jgi:transcriptional antiterminator
MEKIKVDFKSQTLEIISNITVKELLAITNAVDLSSFTIISSINKLEITGVRTESENIIILKSLGYYTNKVIAEKLGLSERTVYRKLKELGI